jgi:hypothetical protein
MIFDYTQMPIHHVAQLLQQISTTTGFTPAEVVAMIDGELNTNDLLDYIAAVMSDRMN